MRWVYRTIRSILVSLLLLVAGLTILLYVLLWLNPVRQRLCRVANSELSELLGARVSIGELSVEPFSRVVLTNAVVEPSPGDTLLHAGEISAGVSLYDLIRRRRLVITDVELMNARIALWRDSLNAPLNAAPVINALRGDGTKRNKSLCLAVQTVIIRSASATYDVLDRPAALPGVFDPHHIALTHLNADLNAPIISPDELDIRLRRLAFSERSGLALNLLTADVALSGKQLAVKGFALNCGETHIALRDLAVNLQPKPGERIANIATRGNAMVCPADFAPLLPMDATLLPEQLSLSGSVELFPDSLAFSDLRLGVDNIAQISARGNSAELHLPQIELQLPMERVLPLAAAFTTLPPRLEQLAGAVRELRLSGSASVVKRGEAKIDATIGVDESRLAVNAALTPRRLHGSLSTPGVDLSGLLPEAELGVVALTADFNLTKEAGMLIADIDQLQWRGANYENISLIANYDGKSYSGELSADCEALSADVSAALDLTEGSFKAEADADIRRFRPFESGLWQKFPGYTLAANLKAHFDGPNPLQPTGLLQISDLTFVDSLGSGLRETPLTLMSDFRNPREAELTLSSSLLDLYAAGSVDLRSLPQTARRLAMLAFPQLFPSDTLPNAANDNNFALNALIHEDAPMLQMVTLPIMPLYDISIRGEVADSLRAASLTVDAPYLRKGKKLWRQSQLKLNLGAAPRLALHTLMPGKQGATSLDLNSQVALGAASTALTWRVENQRDFSGDINLRLRPLPGGLDASILPGRMTFNDTIWEISPSYVGVRGKSVVVSGLNIEGPGQRAFISGVVSPDSADMLRVSLENLDLDYLFETLNISPAVVFGGTATGEVSARALLSGEPILQTDRLFVKDLSYGHAVFGDGKLRAAWDNDARAITIRADIADRDSTRATVDGAIYPLAEKLDFRFGALHVPASFLHTFMATWADEVGGRASGQVHLFGDFKNVDIEGDVVAEDFSIKVGYTGCTYFASDSLHMRPGRIEIPGVTVRDAAGHTARLSGTLLHNHFLDSRFRFDIADVKGLQVIDIPRRDDLRWYGSVRCSGSASISGRTGLVEIGADVRTSPGSNFTFVISSAEEAANYNFLTFRSAAEAAVEAAPGSYPPGSAQLDRHIEQLVSSQLAELAPPADLNVTIRVDVTPEAKINLLMDPVAGDKIAAFGSGHLDMMYESGNDDLRLYGDYVIAGGDYNFTLQDIIIKNFTIREGSMVAFHGDPMDASLNINATYQLNANLTDLDDSFLNDKEVQRTNVPVQAVLMLGGELQSPEIAFDLDFPTLSSDVKRKVRSIVSTDEMMNRQIIYLLALNRFYTPDYMAGATKGNEFASLASGTISSQLSNLLGQLSDKFSVAPSVRSDAGDFSDVEFDVALSSTLLNNRLLLNGNFGYRDKSLNNNQFIGDFDIEYLLNRSGNWRLKAYNHFNDRNLYVKTALTTQGIGVVFKHDFD